MNNFFTIFLFYCKVWTLTLFVETLHHLNDLHKRCCKHWFFWGNFRPFFDTLRPKRALNSDFFWMLWPLFNYFRILRTPNTKILFIKITTEREMWFIAEKKFCAKNCRPPIITIFAVGFDNFYALCDSYAIHFRQCQTFNWKEKIPVPHFWYHEMDSPIYLVTTTLQLGLRPSFSPNISFLC